MTIHPMGQENWLTSSKRKTRVHVLHRAGKLGLGTAYLAGFK
jgi:hypothetical protein